MTSFLSAELTTIPHPDDPPRRLARLGTIAGTEVTIPYLGKRTARTRVSMRSKAAQAIMELDRPDLAALGIALKVRYCTPVGRKLAFHGPVLEPHFDYDAGVIDIAAIGPEDRLATAYVVAGDVAISPGITTDGRGMRQLLAMGQNRPNQDALNWASLGIIPGSDTATRSSFRQTFERGDEIYTEGFEKLGQMLVVPDWEFEPFETDPTSVAIGDLTDATDHALGATVTTIDLVSVFTGSVGKLRVGLHLDATRPAMMKVELKHPDGTWITLWDEGAVADDVTATFLGDGAADDHLCFFADKGAPLYGTMLSPVAYPRIGQFFAIDGPPALFYGRPAGGTWQLRITRDAGAATLHHVSLRFEQPEPAYARLNTSDKPDSDAPDIKAVFHKGFGKHNAKRLNVTPMGSLVRNEAVAISHLGNSTVRQNGAARNQVGTRQSWLSSGQKDDDANLVEKADAIVIAYARAPLNLDLQPVDDHGQPNLPRLLFDFKVGEHVEGHARREKCGHAVVGRVTSATLRQLSGAVETVTETIPTVGSLAEVGDSDSVV